MQDYQNTSNYNQAPATAYYQPYQQPNLYRQAQRRVRERLNLYRGIVTYILVNAMLISFWATSGADIYNFWPGWVMLFWGIGIVFSVAHYLLRTGVNDEEMIRDEMHRMGY